MAARRPKNAVDVPSREESIKKALDSFDLPGAEPTYAYASLRVKAPVHQLRHGSTPNLVEAKDEQTVTFSAIPYPHFKVLPGGVEIPIDNVASAIPKTAAIAAKLSRNGRLAAREKRLAEKMAANPRLEPKVVRTRKGGTQEIPPDEDEPMTLDDENDVPAEGDDGDDGIDV